MQQEIHVNVQVETVPFGTFQYRFAETTNDTPEKRPPHAKVVALPPYYLPSATGDLHGPVVIPSSAG